MLSGDVPEWDLQNIESSVMILGSYNRIKIQDFFFFKYLIKNTWQTEKSLIIAIDSEECKINFKILVIFDFTFVFAFLFT